MMKESVLPASAFGTPLTTLAASWPPLRSTERRANLTSETYWSEATKP